MATPTNVVVSGDAVIKLTDVAMDGSDISVTCGFYMPGLSYTLDLGLSVSTNGGSQPTLSQVKDMDWSEVKKACHNYIEENGLLDNFTYSEENSGDPVMVGGVKDIDYSGSYSEDPFVSYYLVKAELSE